MSAAYAVRLDGLLIHRTAGYFLAPEGFQIGADSRDAITELARRHGAAVDTEHLGEAIIELSGLVAGDTDVQLHERIDTLRGRCAPGKDITVEYQRYRDDEWWQMVARLSGRFETRHVNGGGAFYAVTLAAGNPLSLSVTEHEASYDPTKGHQDIGVTFDLTFDLTFSGTVVSQLDLFNAGNMPTAPLWRIEGPATNPVIESLTTGQRITTVASLSVGQELWIDVARRTARLGAADGTLRLDLIDEAQTDWFDLPPGPSAVRLTGTGMTTDQTSLTARWRDARLPD